MLFLSRWEETRCSARCLKRGRTFERQRRSAILLRFLSRLLRHKTMRFGACQSSHRLYKTGRQSPVAAASCAIKGLERDEEFFHTSLFLGILYCLHCIGSSMCFFLISLLRSFNMILFVVSKHAKDMLPSHPVLFGAKGMQKAASVWTLGPTSAEGWHTTVSFKRKIRCLIGFVETECHLSIVRVSKSFDDVCRERFTV